MDAHTDRLRRCDRCGAAAKFQVLITPEGGELLFCKHHANEHNAILIGDYVMLPIEEPLVQVDPTGRVVS